MPVSLAVWVLPIVALVILLRYCERQQPSSRFFAAAGIGFVAGGAIGFIAVLRPFVRTDITAESAVLAQVSRAAPFITLGVGGAGGALVGVGLLDLIRGPSAKRVGAFLGLVAGLGAGVPLMLLVPERYFEVLERLVVVGTLIASGVAGALIGLYLGAWWTRLGRMGQKQLLVGGVVLTVVGALLPLTLTSVRLQAHINSPRQLQEARNLKALLYKVERQGGLQSPSPSPIQLTLIAAYAETGPNEALRHENPRMQYSGAIVLGRRGDTRVLPLLIELVKRKEEWAELSLAAAGALHNFRNEQAVQVLMQTVSDLTPGLNTANSAFEDRLLEAAAASLVSMRERRAVPTLIEALKQARNPGTQDALIEGLEAIGDPQAVPVLISLIEDKSRTIREESRRALRSLGTRDARIALRELYRRKEKERLREEREGKDRPR